ncbi:MAG: thermonuclease family protein [Pseudomonadota bacterium]
MIAQPLAAEPVTGQLRIIDGDTIEVANKRIRLFGIDAPEHGQPCVTLSGQTWSCGEWVTEQVRTRFDGQLARCITQDTDRYGRIVAICEVAGEDMGDVLVSDGLAYAYRLYSMRYDLQEKAALIADRGIHSFVMQSPARYRVLQKAGKSSPPDDCHIKGNISRNGARIYHMPGQRFYARTSINLQNGERWFCSEAQARASGWRAAKR